MTTVTRLPGSAVVERLRQSHERERLLIEAIPAADVRGRSLLPGWTRAHVLGSRLAFTEAAIRQLRPAERREQIAEFYDGGRVGRDRTIEHYAGLPPAELTERTVAALDALDDVWSTVSARHDWAGSVYYRGPSTIRELASASWRESELHQVDLDMGVGPASWSAEFCSELFDFLTPRVPDGICLLLVADGIVRALGSGTPVRITGRLTDLAAWLAGRPTDGTLLCSESELPRLQRLGAGPTARQDNP